MSDKIETVKSLDLTGFACPIPIVKVSKAIKEVNQGEVIEALTSDSGALADFPAWARTSGNEIIKSEKEGKKTRFFIKRT
jgi:tRNA 2-thiouridine synthesizing protein A